MMYFAWMKQIIKRIFRSLYLYIAIFFFISCMSVYIISGVADDKHTTINRKKYKDDNIWIYNLGKKTTETVLFTESFENLNTIDKYIVQTVTLVTIFVVISIACVLIQCCLYGTTFFSLQRQRIEPNAAIPDMPVHRRRGRRIG